MSTPRGAVVAAALVALAVGTVGGPSAAAQGSPAVPTATVTAVIPVGTGATVAAGTSWTPSSLVREPDRRVLAPADLDQPGPGVVLGIPVATSTLRAATRTDRYPATYSRTVRVAGTTERDDGTGRVRTLTAPMGRPGLFGLTEHVAPSCSGDGQDGNRVQAIYAVEAGRPDRFAEVQDSLQSFVADVDDTFALSSRESARRVRWVSDAECVPVIDEVVVPAGTLAGADLNPLKRALQKQGYSRGDRKYLVFADAHQLCGVADVYLDDRPSAANANNGGLPMYGRVDTPCWPVPRGGHSTPAHELMHMLGAVQSSAPHATANNHCTDERDAMCYADGTSTNLSYVCTQPDAEELFDCHRDDYYDPRPDVTSAYLRSHWNTARSSFLDRPGTSFDQDQLPPTGGVSGPARIRSGSATTLRVTTDRVVDVSWAASPAVCVPRGASGRSVRLQCPTSSHGRATVTATLTDDQGRSSRVNRIVALAGPKARLAVTVSGPDSVAVGATANLRVQVRHGAAPVLAALSLQQYDRATRRWTTVATATTDVAGVARIPVRRSTPGVRTLRVKVRVGQGSGWVVSPSPSRRLTVVRS